MGLRTFAYLAVALIAAGTATAQRPGPAVTPGPIYLNSANPDAAISFWTDSIGASTYTHGSERGVSMLGAILLFTQSAPSGPSTGSVIDHLALVVPDLQPFIDKVGKTTYKISQPKAGAEQLFIDGPDGVRIEMIEDSNAYARLSFHHLHLQTSQPKDMQAWYAKNFGARTGTGEDGDSIAIGGETITISQAVAAAPSAGRAIDHVAFEVKDLAGFCKGLGENGVKVDSPCRFVTDPWGTRIELAEAGAR